MNRMLFEPPTEYYNKKIEAIDEQICSLIKQRKDQSNNNPGFPTKHLIKAWAKEYNFYENFLNSMFTDFLNEDMYKPVVEPKQFIKNIPVLRSFERDRVFYSVTFVRQYKNASVVHFNIDREEAYDEMPERNHEHTFFDLSIKDSKKGNFDCRNEGGGGSGGHESYTFIVSPALSDDITSFKFVFKGYKIPSRKKTDFEIII